MKQETHFSQATPPGRGAISIIRLSGPMQSGLYLKYVIKKSFHSHIKGQY